MYEVKSVKQCGDGGWRVFLSDNAGSPPVRRRYQAANIEQAERIAAGIEAEINGRWTVGIAVDVCISDAAATVTASTLTGYRRLAALLNPISSMFIDHIGSGDVQAFLDALSCSYGRHTVRKVHDFLNRACAVAVARGGATFNPCSEIPSPKRPAPETASLDVDRLSYQLVAMLGPSASAVALVAFCGLRVGEIAVLRNIDIVNGVIMVTKRITRGAALKRQIIEYDVPKTERVPRWIERSITENCTSPYLYGGDKPASVDSLSQKMRWTLDCVGCECTLAQLRNCANKQTHRSINA